MAMCVRGCNGDLVTRRQLKATIVAEADGCSDRRMRAMRAVRRRRR